jgi:rfaE bifunctional protein nucleotidyltransferase chain/domain
MIIPFYKLSEIREKQAAIIHCHGVFDILHAGHLAYLESAAKVSPGARLVVTITADRFVNKGPGKPVFPAEIRAKMLDALKIVDYVAISEYPTATAAINELKPDYYVKGPDYRDKTKDVTGEIHNEEAAVKAHGGEIIFTEDETYSSSTLANRFFVNWSDEQSRIIDRVKDLGGMNAISTILDKLGFLKVLTVGEPILDTYRFCNPENLSSKYPCVSARFAFQERYHGGAWAIERHVRDFVKSSEIVYPHQEHQIPEKIRYISVDKSQRMFEVTDINDNLWETENPREFIGKVLDKSKASDMTIVADFGHGLFEGPVVECLDRIDGFVALNVQTNSSNYGFNPYTKHERFDYLSIDTREARVAFHDRHSSPLSMAKRVHVGSEKPVSLTCGSNGAYYIRRDNYYFSPAFADNVVDATGAGDAYFAMTAMLVKVDCNPELIPFLGNVFAGLKTKIIGNKQSVTKAQFIKALQGILK